MSKFIHCFDDKLNVSEWKKHFPDYEIKIWGEDQLQKAKGMSRELNKFRVLKDYGGIYTDSDIIPTHRFDTSVTPALLDGVSTRLMIGEKGQKLWDQLLHNPNVEKVVNDLKQVVGNVKSSYVEFTNKISWLYYLYRNWKYILGFVIILIVVIVFIMFEVIYGLNKRLKICEQKKMRWKREYYMSE